VEEGWFGDDYLILFAGSELRAACKRYAISDWLPGYEVVGLKGWDDLIVRDAGFRTYSIPAVPLDLRFWSPLRFLSTVQSSKMTTASLAKSNGMSTRLHSAARSPTRIRLGLIIQLTESSLGIGTSYIIRSSRRSLLLDVVQTSTRLFGARIAASPDQG
jgi:hypothetical protein